MKRKLSVTNWSIQLKRRQVISELKLVIDNLLFIYAEATELVKSLWFLLLVMVVWKYCCHVKVIELNYEAIYMYLQHTTWKQFTKVLN